MTDTNDPDLISHVTLFGATVLDRVLDKKPLPYLPGGPLEMRATLGKLMADKLIREGQTPSGYSLTKKGREVCDALWGQKNS